MSKNIVSASIVAISLALWLGSGQLPSSRADGAQADDPSHAPAVQASNDGFDRVRVSVLGSERRTRHVVLRGRTESKRIVDVKAEIAGSIVSRPVERGMQVSQGDLLCEIAVGRS